MIEFNGYLISEITEPNKPPYIWIGFPSGEGMGMSYDNFAKWLDRIYKEDF